MKCILAVTANEGVLDALLPAASAAGFQLLPAYTDGAAVEALLDASVALDAIVFCESVAKQTRSTIKQLLYLEDLDFTVINHQGAEANLLATLTNAAL